MAIKREVSTEEGNEYAAKNNIFFRETSAMDNVDVQLAFEEIVRGDYYFLLFYQLHLIFIPTFCYRNIFASKKVTFDPIL